MFHFWKHCKKTGTFNPLLIKYFLEFEIAVEEGNPGTDSPNLQHPQDGDPEVGDPEAGDPETGYHEYHENESKSNVNQQYLVYM